MKIKNEYIKIKNSRTYDFRNTITSDYLKLFSKSQYDDSFKIKAPEKALKYVYIKTGDISSESRENSNKSYYNLINIHDLESSGDGSFTIKDFDWLGFTGKTSSVAKETKIQFKNNDFIKKGDNYRILLEMREILISSETSVALRIAEKEFSVELLPNTYEHAMYVSARYGNKIKVTRNSDGNYLFALHRNNYGKYLEDANIYIQSVDGNPTNVSFDFRISLIKEENNQDYVEQLSFNEYMYNKYIDFSSLAANYNYRLPSNQKFYESNNSCIDTYYTFDNTSGYYKSDGTGFAYVADINEMANKQILQLAFGNDNTIYAFVDIATSNVIVEKDIGLYIYRKDRIKSDAYYTGDGIPVHLSPLGYKINGTTYYAELYSVGLGFFKGLLNEEYLVKENPIEEIDDNTFRITLEKGINETLTPSNTLYPHANLMPVLETHLGNEIYPSKVLQPSNLIYPSIGKYKYVMYKYRLYSIKGLQTIPINKYYVMSFYTESQGTTRVDTKYERS